MNNFYRRTMDQIQFRESFNRDTVLLLKRREPSRKKRKYFVGGVAVACVAVAVIAALPAITDHKTGLPQESAAGTNVAVPGTSDDDSGIGENAGQPQEETAPRMPVVKASDYPAAYMADSVTPGQGTVHIDECVQSALDDPRNAGAFFFVQIDMVTPYMYEHKFDDFVYNGRSLAEWSVLTDLADDAYPYSEYNMDFGGNVTEEEWMQAKREAKTLNARENYDKGYAEYMAYDETAVTPIIESQKADEYDRLKRAGYEVMYYDTWEYGDGKTRVDYPVLAGLLSKEQIESLPMSGEYGYSIGWIINGDGQIVDWNG